MSIKPLHTTTSLDKNFVIRPFLDNTDLFFFYKKIERISAAIYLVTDLINDQEPLKNSLRRVSLIALENAGSLFSETKDKFIKDKIIIDLTKCLSYLEVAVVGGFVSRMNFSILENEINAVSKYLARFDREVVSRDKPIPESLLDMSDVTAFLARNYSREVAASRLHKRKKRVGQNNTSSDSNRSVMGRSLEVVVKENYQGDNKGQNTDSDIEVKGQTLKKGGNGIEMSRINTVISMLKNSDKLNLSDFSSVIKDCSEKTIQRILIKLVGDGVLKKYGVKRWSVYSLSDKNPK